ncbi:MAG: hypothetical protein IKA87_08490 [Lentisphaeria bacterium]|nr:hypothetical protein [Lentisphaeria bacterium]
MPNIQQILNDEIRRLARKETSGALKELKAQIVELRKTIAALNRRIKTLEKGCVESVESAAAVPAEDNAGNSKAVRVTAERIVKWRTKLGVNKSQYAELLGVNLLSVIRWESGKSVPRAEQKRRIVELRDMGKRELGKLLAEKNISPKVK